MGNTVSTADKAIAVPLNAQVVLDILVEQSRGSLDHLIGMFWENGPLLGRSEQYPPQQLPLSTLQCCQRPGGSALTDSANEPAAFQDKGSVAPGLQIAAAEQTLVEFRLVAVLESDPGPEKKRHHGLQGGSSVQELQCLRQQRKNFRCPMLSELHRFNKFEAVDRHPQTPGTLPDACETV